MNGEEGREGEGERQRERERREEGVCERERWWLGGG